MRYTRREFLKVGAAGAAGVVGLAVVGCGPGTSGGTTVDLLYDWTYNGPPGKNREYWQTLKRRLGEQDVGARLGSLAEVPFETLYSTVETQTRARSGADVATWYADYHTFREERRGNIVAIDDLVAPDSADHWLLASSKFDGQFYGNPLVMEIGVLAVNRRLLDQAGVEVGTDFESYDTFIEACDKLKAAGITPIQAGTSDGFNAEKWLYLLQFQVCEDITEFLQGIVGELDLDAPFFKFPREALVDLVANYMNENPQDDTEEIAPSQFLNGRAGMMMMYTHPVFAPNAPSEFDVVGFPMSTAKFNRPVVGTADNLILMSYSDEQEAGGALFDFINQPEQVNLWWDLNRTLPANDRLDASVLPPPAQRVWDLVTRRKEDIFATWWPGNQPPNSLFTFQYGVTQNIFAGGSADAARQETEKIFSEWRQQNPDELEIVTGYKNALAATVAELETMG
jgi:ABC-type glycerol-3-phosphate transport system substrate-binding protein